MVNAQSLVLASALVVTAAQAELLLMPTVAEYKADGATLKRLEFYDDGKTVSYQSPNRWEYFGDATKLTLRPPNKAQAEATITRVPLPQPGSFDNESLKRLVNEAIVLVPKGSENVSVVSQEKNLLIIGQKETFLITLSYTFYGQRYGRSILFLNRGNEQIRSQLTCHEADFKELHQAFLRSQNTWENL